MSARRLVLLLLIGLAGTGVAAAPVVSGLWLGPHGDTVKHADPAIVRALQAALSEHAPSVIAGATTRAAVRAFYRQRDFAPLWIDSGKPSTRYRLAADYLASIDSEGLVPADYGLPDLSGDTANLAQLELVATRTVLRYAQDANGGRLDARTISSDIAYPSKTLDIAAFLNELSDPSRVVAALQALHPSHPHYRALKFALAELRASGGATDTVIANMERWRWLPRGLEPTRVVVNLPDYTLRLFEQGELAFVARAVVGSPATPTPLIVSAMTSMTVNPVWNVPRSIASSRAMQPFIEDAALREQVGLTMSTDLEGRTTLAQAPGGFNPLGRVRFNFPNAFAVYQHDTPDPSPFERRLRGLSHGCVRVENALSYAETILAMELGEQAGDRIKALLREEDIDVPLAKPLPVYLTYETMAEDDNGEWRPLPDIYHYDARMTAQLRARQIRPDRITLPAPAPSGLFDRFYRRVVAKLAAVVTL